MTLSKSRDNVVRSIAGTGQVILEGVKAKSTPIEAPW